LDLTGFFNVRLASSSSPAAKPAGLTPSGAPGKLGR